MHTCHVVFFLSRSWKRELGGHAEVRQVVALSVGLDGLEPHSRIAKFASQAREQSPSSFTECAPVLEEEEPACRFRKNLSWKSVIGPKFSTERARLRCVGPQAHVPTAGRC